MNLEEKSTKYISSPYINEIIEKKPNWLIRYGIGAMLFFLFLFLVAAWLVNYPDIISGKVSITTRRPPVDMTAMVNAPVAKNLSFKENDTIKKGNAIMILESTVSYKQVRQLYNHLSKNIQDTSLLNSKV